MVKHGKLSLDFAQELCRLPESAQREILGITRGRSDALPEASVEFAWTEIPPAAFAAAGRWRRNIGA